MTGTGDNKKLIVVGVDGSKASKAALRWAVHHAVTSGATVRAVAAWHDAQVGERHVGHGFVDTGKLEDEAFSHAAERGLDEALAELRANEPGAAVEGRVLHGHPATVLLDEARDADLLVLGDKGRSTFVGVLIGSVVLRVLHHAPCPVVVVPGPTGPQ